MRCWPLWLLLCGCSGQPAIAPDGIVSNNPCIDAILAEVASPNQIAAISTYSHDPNNGSAPIGWAKKLPAIGDSAEEIIAAHPRLLLTGNLATSGTNDALRRAGVRLKALGVPVNIRQSEDQIRQVAKAIGRSAAGEILVAKIEAALKSPSPSVVKNMTALIWQADGFVAGKGTVQDDLLTRMGYRNMSAVYGLKSWDHLPLETMIDNPPQVIFMPVKAKGDDARALAIRGALLKHLRGRTHIVPFPQKLLFCAGPSLIEAAKIMKTAQ